MKETKCYALNSLELDNEELFFRTLELLPWEERRQRVGGFVHRKDRLLSLGAGLLLYHVLSENGVMNFALETNEFGKPKLVAHHDIHFNLSHSGEYAVCAIGSSPLGVDVEHIGEPDRMLAEAFFTNAENEWLKGSEDFQSDFFRLWTLKESYIKKIGKGLSIPLNSFSIFPGVLNGSGISQGEYPSSCAASQVQQCGKVKHEKLLFTEFALPEHWVAVCSENCCAPVMQRVAVNQTAVLL